MVRPGCCGVRHGSELHGELIPSRHRILGGARLVYIGNGQIVEGLPPAARVAPGDSDRDALWNAREPLTDDQRLRIVAQAQALVGTVMTGRLRRHPHRRRPRGPQPDQPSRPVQQDRQRGQA